MKQKNEKKRGLFRAILAVVAALILIVGALLVLLYRDKLTPERLSDTFAGENRAADDAEPFTYEIGSGQVFAMAGNNLAVASTTGVQMLNDKGETTLREVFSMNSPAICSVEKYCVFYDAGGTALRLCTADGSAKSLTEKNKIVSAHVNENGLVSVITEDTGYKASVTVYDTQLQPLFAWHSGSAYLLGAQVSPNSRTLSVLCADTEGCRVMFFSLSSEKPLGSFEAGGELFWDLRWMGRDRLCVLSDKSMVFLDANAKQTSRFDFGDRYLLDYDIGGSFAAIVLGEYRSGGSSELVTVDSDAREKGRTGVRQRDILSVSISTNGVLVLYADSLELLTDSLSPVNSTQDVLGVKSALLRKDGKCLMLSAYSAELISLR